MRKFYECGECGEIVPADEFCRECENCDQCCECSSDLFDADELGLDPEDDDLRRYPHA